VNMTVTEAAAAMGALGDIAPECDVRLAGICTDSRLLAAGQLFFCLTGENYDAHAFAADAARAGAAAVVVSRPVPEAEGLAPVLMVRDVLQALGSLGAHWRSRTQALVIAVTGSAGKTTVKEMLASILSRLGETAKNAGNFNNQLGVPLTMLGCSGAERFWVLELGISLPGDMDELAAMVRPDVVVIGNIGPAHLEGLGSLEGVATAKTDLLRCLAPGGRSFVCTDYPLLRDKARSIVPALTEFSSKDADCPLRGEYLGRDAAGQGLYRLHLNGLAVELSAPFAGAVFAENMIAAASVAHALGAGAEDIVAGIRDAVVPQGRFEIRSFGDWTLIDDTYNANPLSMRQAVENAAELAGAEPLVLVLGEMRELGAEAKDLHRELGRVVAASRPRAVFYHGEHADAVAEGLGNGLFPGRFERIADPALIAGDFGELGLSGGVVLVKGSRGCRMERYLRALTESIGGRG